MNFDDTSPLAARSATRPIARQHAELRPSEQAATAPPPPRPEGGQRRDHAIDRLRGLCLLSMTVGHLARTSGNPSPLDRIIHAPTWVSGAAGFVFLSGVSVGLLSTARGGWSPQMRRWALGRGGFLLVLGLGLNVAGIAWFTATGLPSWYPATPPTVLTVLTGQWWLLFTDVLAMYAALLLGLAALGHWIIARPVPALAASAGLYAASFAMPKFGPAETPADDPIWNLPAWQLLFVVGLLAGCRWQHIRTTLDTHRRLVLAGGAGGALAVLGLGAALKLSERTPLLQPLDDTAQRSRPSWPSRSWDRCAWC